MSSNHKPPRPATPIASRPTSRPLSPGLPLHRAGIDEGMRKNQIENQSRRRRAPWIPGPGVPGPPSRVKGERSAPPCRRPPRQRWLRRRWMATARHALCRSATAFLPSACAGVSRLPVRLAASLRWGCGRPEGREGAAAAQLPVPVQTNCWCLPVSAVCRSHLGPLHLPASALPFLIGCAPIPACHTAHAEPVKTGWYDADRSQCCVPGATTVSCLLSDD